MNIDNQLIEKIVKFAPIKHILKNKNDDNNVIIELLEDTKRDLNNYDLDDDNGNYDSNGSLCAFQK